MALQNCTTYFMLWWTFAGCLRLEWFKNVEEVCFEEMCACAIAAQLIERKSFSSRRRVGERERKELMQHVGITSTSRGFALLRLRLRWRPIWICQSLRCKSEACRGWTLRTLWPWNKLLGLHALPSILLRAWRARRGGGVKQSRKRMVQVLKASIGKFCMAGFDAVPE